MEVVSEDGFFRIALKGNVRINNFVSCLTFNIFLLHVHNIFVYFSIESCVMSGHLDFVHICNLHV